ncbi:hypothetical protein Hanom_Chr10g00949081 [Helianthus anomalus]
MRKRLNNLNRGEDTSLVNGTPLTICWYPVTQELAAWGCVVVV